MVVEDGLTGESLAIILKRPGALVAKATSSTKNDYSDSRL